MEQYIKKSALVAEIESKKKRAQILGDNAINGSMQQFYDGMKQGCVDILSSINTLEVKDVDLDLEITLWANAIPEIRLDDVKRLAKYFFELGLKTKYGNIGFQNIDDLLEEDGIDPNSKEAKIFKESYYMALEKLKGKIV